MKQLLIIILLSTAIFGQSGKSVLTQAQKDSIQAMIDISVVLTSSDSLGYVSPTTFGAVYDGSTDCLDAINAAVLSLGGNGGTIYFKGTNQDTCILSGSPTWADNIKVVGNIVIRLADGVADSTAIFEVTNLHDITIEGLTLDANYTNQTGKVFAVRSRWFSKNITLRDCNIYNQTVHGLGFFRKDSLITIDNCYFGSTNGYEIQFRASFGVRVINSIFENWGVVTTSPISAIQFQDGGGNAVVTDNTFINVSGLGFGIECTFPFSGADISNNHFYGEYTGISGAFNYSVISGNIFYDGIGTWRSGIETDGNSNIIKDNIIYNGSIVTTTANTAGSDFLGGIQYDTSYTKDNIISGNVIKNQSANGFGIRLDVGVDYQSDVKIVNNIVDLTGTSGSMNGIEIGRTLFPANDYPIYNIFVENNYIYRNLIAPGEYIAGAGLKLSADSTSNYIKFKNNVVKGFTYGFILSTNSDIDWYSDVMVEDNDLVNNSVPILLSTPYPNTYSIRNNTGYLTSYRGTAISSNNGSVTDSVLTVYHSLAITPSGKDILITPTSYLGLATYGYVPDSTITSTYFKIFMNTDPDTVVSFNWKIFEGTPTRYGANFKVNGDFEYFTGGVVDDGLGDSLTYWESTETYGVIEATATAYHGNYAMKITDTTNAGGGYIYVSTYEALPAVSNGSYRLSFWTKGDGTNAGAIRILDVTNPSIITNWTTTEATADEWTYVYFDFTAPPGCLNLNINIGAPNSNGAVIYYDKLELIQVFN